MDAVVQANSALQSALGDRYRIERELGEGGMATVYLAEDLKHDRKVALKVLKPELAAVLGAERFVVEIKTTASLQHPHILPLFDSGQANGFLYYVMPYIDGETLRSRLDRERQLAIDEAVRITREVADALDYAHRHGVIHRDIKPENILLHDGRPMVADFGIALAVSAAAGGRMTETGLSLGTPHYMSPEQATADRDITARSDIYSLASVLYEMLTGEPPHMGTTAQQIIMKILTEDAAPVTRLRKSVPRNVGAAVAKALEKLPADRFASASEFAHALADPSFGDDGGTGLTHGASAGAATNRLALASTAAAVVLLGLAAWGWLRPRPSLPVIEYGLALPASAALNATASAPLPSPDGSFLVYQGPGANGESQLWIKRRERAAPQPIPGTNGAASFALSPDGRTIAFTGPTPGELRKVAVSGGSPVPIEQRSIGADLRGGIAWLDDNTIVAPNDRETGLGVIAADGSHGALLFEIDTARVLAPVPLPGGRAVLFASCTISCASLDLWAFDRQTKTMHHVASGTTGAGEYLEPGYIAYSTPGGGLFAVPYDAGHFAVRGTPIPIADSLSDVGIASPSFHASRAGTLVIARGGSTGQTNFDLAWVDQHGREAPIDTTWTFQLTNYQQNVGWALSPDGTRLAIGLSTGSGDDIWVRQLPHGPTQRVTYDPAPEFRPRWSGDGRYVSFVSARRLGGFYMRRADGVGQDSLLVPGAFEEGVISPDGRAYVLRQGATGEANGGRNIVSLRPGIDKALVPLIATPYDEEGMSISPDGRWIAYQSDETGQTEVFVRPFPNVNSGKHQISRQGGVAPLWSRDGAMLYYVSRDTNMMAVRVREGGQDFGEPAPLFKLPMDVTSVGLSFYTPWDVASDGRFIMARALHAAAPAPRSIIVIENWLQSWTRGLKK